MNDNLLRAFAESSNPEHCKYEFNKLAMKDQLRVAYWVEKLQHIGAVNAIFIALNAIKDESVLTQFDFSRAMKLSFNDVEGNVEEACDYYPDTQEIFEELCQAIGREKVIQFLKQYGEGLGCIVANTLDEGSWCLAGEQVSSNSWAVMELDKDNKPTGKMLGLHEDWYELIRNIGQMNKPITAYLGLGGNINNELGTPTQHILKAVATLQQTPNIENIKISSLYRSKAFGVTDQPDFYNAVVSLDTTLAPLELLDICQAIEQSAGRVRLRHWGERSLDVDILLYGDEIIQNERLTVPHAGLFERNFVVIPLLELDENLTINGKRLIDLPIADDWGGLEVLV